MRVKICDMCGMDSTEEFINYGKFRGCKSHKENGITLEYNVKRQVVRHRVMTDESTTVTRIDKVPMTHKVDMKVCRMGFDNMKSHN